MEFQLDIFVVLNIFAGKKNLETPPQAKKKYSCFWKCLWQEKSSPGRPQIIFSNRFSGDILFSSLVSFAFVCVLVFVCLCVCFRNIYSDTHATMRADEWQKQSSPGWFQEIRLLFWPHLVATDLNRQVKDVFTVLKFIFNSQRNSISVIHFIISNLLLQAYRLVRQKG